MKQKMWGSRYALTVGVKEYEGTLSKDGHFVPDGWICTYWRVGKDVHTTQEEAIMAAEKIRTKQIASLEKQVTLLKALRFSGVA
jgi:hypothetical protein